MQITEHELRVLIRDMISEFIIKRSDPASYVMERHKYLRVRDDLVQSKINEVSERVRIAKVIREQFEDAIIESLNPLLEGHYDDE